MFEWLDRAVLTRHSPAPQEILWRGHLHNADSITLPRAQWRQAGCSHRHSYVIAIGTLVTVQPGIQALSFMIRGGQGAPGSYWDTVPFKFKIDSTSKTTLDEKLVRAIHKSGWTPPRGLTPGGIPWELALIPDLDAQAAAVRAWREETSQLSAM